MQTYEQKRIGIKQFKLQTALILNFLATSINQSIFNIACSKIVDVDQTLNQIVLRKPDSSEVPKSFTFDHVYGDQSTQQQVYDDCAFSLVESVLEGTIFAYGQTGCGKSHTMMGVVNDDPVPGAEDLKGIIPKTVRHVFGFIDGSSDGKKFLVRCSYLEIYNEQILDLLCFASGKNQAAGENLKVKEDPNKGIYVQDLTNVVVKTVPELEKLLNAGVKNRKVGETAMNKDSSRSHSIFTIYVETAEDTQDGNQKFKVGKLNLVDLAGSERQSKTGATGDRLKEAQKINLSLSALGNVISALVDGKSQHIPYRDSKLTRLLQDSLGGNTKTIMIAALSPADYNYDETLSTLRYAARAKCIQNKPKINEDPKDTLLRQYEDEIKQLREMLESMKNGVQMDPRLATQAIMNHQQSLNNKMHVEESVDELIRKLENQGKKIKIIDDDEIQESMDIDAPKSARAKKQITKKMSNSGSKSQKSIVEDTSSSIVGEMESKLKEKEELLNDHVQQKDRLEQMLYDLQKQMVQGGSALEEKEKEQAQKYREFQLRLKKQKKKEKELLREKEKKEEEMLMVEKQYKSLQEEVEEQREVIKQLRMKYKQAASEVKDLEQEHQIQKESLLDSVRDQDLDLKFYKRIVKMMLRDDEIAKLKLKSQYEDDDWLIPAFVLKGKEMTLPKVNGRQMMEREKDEREMEITEVGAVDAGGSRSTGDSDSDDQQAYRKQVMRTAKDTQGSFAKSTISQKMNQTKKDGNGNTGGSSLRRSGIEFPFEKDAPLVKNNKVNAQLAPIEYNTMQVGQINTGQLPPPMSREELMNLERNHKNVSIENLLNQDTLVKGGKNQLAPLQPRKKM
ncbi:kinesin motor domain containing protein [Stylonychia lemnae]|uniref:Kinesin-like protein n=1 Tax=Stylonychia lemnae TaxID=5949 RepID=A0A078AG88_STYLE|nr:kinesin motor domain containing protein [Stylonychia lemnae]|eukprot:CDW81244.1 kinesin motor domain containing protein [Stylonychia lemnae]